MISASGNVVVYQSAASNLVPEDDNGFDDVVVYDRALGSVQLISAAANGGPANGPSTPLAVSPDGRFVIFSSTATNLTRDPAPATCNPATTCTSQIYLRNRTAGTTELISRATGGEVANLASGAAAVSANGRYVAFASFATNLVAGDTNQAADVFLRDRTARRTARVSVGPSGVHTDGVPQISADGRYVAFPSADRHLRDLPKGSTQAVVWDRSQRRPIIASATDSGPSAGTVRSVSVAGNGAAVAFDSVGGNLLALDENGVADIVLRVVRTSA